VATHPAWSKETRLNLDRDRALELVKLSYDVSSDHQFERGSVTARDTCGGNRVTAALIPAGRFTPRLALRPAQLGRAGVGFLAEHRGGPRLAAVARLRNCRPQVLLSFSSAAAATVELDARNYAARFPGREVVVVEGLRDGARRTFFRWAPARQRYVKFRTSFSAA
jgi:hypothetical protein